MLMLVWDLNKHVPDSQCHGACQPAPYVHVQLIILLLWFLVWLFDASRFLPDGHIFWYIFSFLINSGSSYSLLAVITSEGQSSLIYHCPCPVVCDGVPSKKENNFHHNSIHKQLSDRMSDYLGHGFYTLCNKHLQAKLPTDGGSWGEKNKFLSTFLINMEKSENLYPKSLAIL